MPLYDLNLSGVEAKDISQAEQVKESLVTIVNRLKPQEIIDLAALLKEKPGIVEKAKQFRNIL
jgi:hypothetical protein